MGFDASLGHLARRYAGSLSRAEPAADDERWAVSHLQGGELVLWRRMSAADRRHAIGVARSLRIDVDSEERPDVVAAALLHDVGKVASGLGPNGRAMATLWSAVVGRSRATTGEGRVSRYLRHDAIGARLLDLHHARPLAIVWAADHHRPRAAWRVPPDIGDALKAADDD